MLNFKGFHGDYKGHMGVRILLDMILTFFGIFLYSVIMLLLVSFILNSIIYLTFNQIILFSLVLAFLGTIGRGFYVMKKGTRKNKL